jgi:outer membrane protein assembly factor BamB/enterochelin esterase-like enzyme
MSISFRRSLIVSSCALAVSCNGIFVVPALADDWPGFRGADASGVAGNSNVLGKGGGLSLEISWKKTIGSGYSGVSIAAGRVVTMFSDGAYDVVAAWDEQSGKELWRFQLEGTYEGHDGSHTGPISTPLIAEGRVFGLSARGRLVALDFASGELVWSTHLVDDHQAKKPHYGFGTSPLMVKGVLVVQLGGEHGALAGFDPKSGQRRWVAGSDNVAYQAPIPFALAEKVYVLSPGDKKLLAVDPTDGAVIGEFEHGGDGAIGAQSLVPVSVGERRILLKHSEDASKVIELGGAESLFNAKPLWAERSIRNSYNIPVYYNGAIYAYSSRFLTCVDPATGEPKWRSRRPGDGFLIVADGHLVVVTKTGTLHLARASQDDYHELASMEVFKENAWTPPSFANDHIFVRSLGELARIAVRHDDQPVAERTERNPILIGTRFAAFLDEVAAAEDKSAVVDRFLAAQKEFPVIEGRELVHFVYRGPAEDLALAGDIIGARQEREMVRVPGTDFYHYSSRIEPDARANYMFVKDYKSMPDPRNSRKTTTTVYKEDMEMNFGDTPMEMSWFAMPAWEMPKHLSAADSASKGRIENREFESTALEAEGKKPTIAIHVYLPTGYENGDDRYPVAYVHGGKDAQERGEIPKLLDYEIGKRIRPVIAVFINFSPQFGQGGYDKMVADELIPFVDQNFRTIASRDGRAHVGGGFHGFLALQCAFTRADLSSKVASQSSILFGGMTDMIKAAIPSAEETPMTIYFEWGKYDLRNPQENWSMVDENRNFAEALKEKGFRLHGGEVHDGTDWSSWRNRVDRIFVALFPI